MPIFTWLDFTLPELTDEIAALGYPPYRARQLFRWLHSRGINDPQRMTDLPSGLRRQLAEHARLNPTETVRRLDSQDGRTSKLLVGLHDGELIETVVMDSGPVDSARLRRTVCISSQAGCAMACVFCATGQMGFARQLSPGEIVAQVYLARRPGEQPVTNVVMMGMGEPLANYQAVVKAIRLLNDPSGMHMSPRRITLSTVGLVPQIRELAREGLGVNLAISLHATGDELRSRMMPVNGRWPIAELLAAGDEFAARTGRRVSYEYVLIRGVNDTPEHAHALGRLLAGRLCHVNLIPLNPTLDRSLEAPEGQDAHLFERRVAAAGIPCTVRINRGRDIDAACGQLRRRAEAGAGQEGAA